jgi:hypothetical protein
MNKWIRGTNAVVLSAAVVGIFLILTLFLHSVKGFQVDLTANKSFTLSDQTLDTLKNLDQDIRIIAFTNSGENDFITRQVMDMLEEYKKRSGKLTVEQYDMLKQPSMARQYGVDASGTLIFELGEQRKNVNFYEMFNTGGQQDGSYQFSGEEKLTQALVSLTSKDKHFAYFLSGHQEVPLNQLSVLRSSLESDNYEVKELNLLREGKIPDDAQILFLVGAQNDLSDQETELIGAFLKDKGKIYIALGFNPDMTTKWKNIDSIMSQYGIKDQHAIAIEAKQTTLFDPLTIIPEYGYHSVTSKLSEYNLLTMMSLAVALNTEGASEEWTQTALLRTTSQAYGETDIPTLLKSQTSKGTNDIAGPLNLGYAVEDKDKKPKAIILGGSTFLMDQEIQNQGNRDFALNSIGWLQEQTNQVTIRPRQGDAYIEAFVTASQANTIFYGTLVFFPLVFLLFGGLIWWRRRQG